MIHTDPFLIEEIVNDTALLFKQAIENGAEDIEKLLDISALLEHDLT